MTKDGKLAILLLRLTLGWYFFYAGFSKIINPEWSAAGYLNNAGTFPNFFAWFASPANIGWVNILNEWGLTLIGVALILGFATRIASFAGILLMLLYYFPALNFPMAGHGYIIDDHIIFIAAFLVLIAFDAGKYWGIGGLRRRGRV